MAEGRYDPVVVCRSAEGSHWRAYVNRARRDERRRLLTRRVRIMQGEANTLIKRVAKSRRMRWGGVRARRKWYSMGKGTFRKLGVSRAIE